MCFGGGGDQYSAYSSGHYDTWKTAFDQKAGVEERLARGEITQEQADTELAAVNQNDLGLASTIRQDAAANMDSREYMRQHDIKLGQIGIDKNFSKFNDDYYQDYRNSYSGYYNPQLDEQHAKAVDKMSAALVDRGMGASSVGSAKMAELARQNADARTNIANESLDASNKLRSQVSNAKSNLYSINEASADPQSVNAQAVGSATSLVAPPTYSPLGQVFTTAFDGFSNYASARNNSPTRTYSSPYGGSATGYGSGRVVR